MKGGYTFAEETDSPRHKYIWGMHDLVSAITPPVPPPATTSPSSQQNYQDLSRRLDTIERYIILLWPLLLWRVFVGEWINPIRISIAAASRKCRTTWIPASRRFSGCFGSPRFHQSSLVAVPRRHPLPKRTPMEAVAKAAVRFVYISIDSFCCTKKINLDLCT